MLIDPMASLVLRVLLSALIGLRQTYGLPQLTSRGELQILNSSSLERLNVTGNGFTSVADAGNSTL